METIYIEGDFIEYIRSFGDKAQIIAIEGKYRWRIEREDGTFYIARPIETKLDEKSLKKILDELNTENPRLDYIKGMLEVMIDEDEVKLGETTLVDINTDKGTFVSAVASAIKTANVDEGAMLDSMAAANLATIQRLAQQSND